MNDKKRVEYITANVQPETVTYLYAMIHKVFSAMNMGKHLNSYSVFTHYDSVNIKGFNYYGLRLSPIGSGEIFDLAVYLSEDFNDLNRKMMAKLFINNLLCEFIPERDDAYCFVKSARDLSISRLSNLYLDKINFDELEAEISGGDLNE